MKKIVTSIVALVVVFGLVGVANATDHYRQRIVVERVVKAPIVERVVEYREVPQLRVVEKVVVDDYGREFVRQKVIVDKRRVQKVQVERVEKVVKKNVVRNQSFLGRLLGR